MASQVCCVDHIQPGTKVIAGRWFCDEHYTRATHKRPGVMRAEIIAVIGLLVFVGLVIALDAALPEFAGLSLVITGVVLALVPALLWLAFFYLQDRLEPEPVGHVARIFVIGLALAAAIGVPLTDQVFGVSNWLYRDPLTELLGSVFVIGAIQAFIVYATVRYFIFDSPEFDERTDGVVYGTAAGLGVATAMNLQFILSSGGAALGSGEVFVVEVALAQAAFGGLLGYFLGRAKLEQEPTWWLPAGVALTAALNGLFLLLRGQLDAGSIARQAAGGGLPTLTGLLLAGALAVIIAFVVGWLVNRDIGRSLATAGGAAAEADPTIGDRQANYGVLGLLVVMLLIGALAWWNASGRTAAFNAGGVQAAYPAHWGQAALGEGQLLHVADTLGTGAEYAVSELPGVASAEAAQRQLAANRGDEFEVYTLIDSGPATVNGRPALRQRFAYVVPAGLGGGAPQLIEGVDYIVAEADRAVVISLTSPAEDFDAAEPGFERFVQGVKFQ